MTVRCNNEKCVYYNITTGNCTRQLITLEVVPDAQYESDLKKVEKLNLERKQKEANNKGASLKQKKDIGSRFLNKNDNFAVPHLVRCANSTSVNKDKPLYQLSSMQFNN